MDNKQRKKRKIDIMKTRILFTFALLAGLILGSCSREEIPGMGTEAAGNRVVFTLAGITPKKNTRAMGDNDLAQADPMAATDEEKKVTSLIAAAYEKQPSGQMGFYKAFDVTVTDDGCSFDIAKDGRFDLYLIANADGDLADKIKALDAGSAVTNLEELIVTQAPDAANAFVMTTPEALKIISYSGEVADCGEVTLRRLSVRIDILNKADGLTITKITYHNRTVKSQLMTPNTMISAPGAVEEKAYDGLSLVGNFTSPAEYKSMIYSYENPSRRGDATVPTLDIEYTLDDDGQTYTHTIEFLDANDPSGLTPLALKRNYLYRITVGRKLEPEFNIEVVDWTNVDSFNVDEIPFQAQMNASLAINNFATSYVATLSEGEDGAAGSITFVESDPMNNSGLFPWSDKWATSYYYEAKSNAYYRVPTRDEAYLLFPDETHAIQFDEAMTGDSEIDETLPNYLFGSTEKNGGAGKSIFRNAAAASGVSLQGTRAAGPAYPICYAIRFKGTAQYAAYRYETKNQGDPVTGEMEIRIKALQAGSLLTIDDVANEAYWGNPTTDDSDADNQLIWHIAAAGYKDSSDQDAAYKGTNSLIWTSTSVDETNARDYGHNPGAALVATFNKAAAGTLLMVKLGSSELQSKLNAALKVNRFTAFNVKSIDAVQNKVTFFSKLAVTPEECPTTSYFSYQWLKGDDADGITSSNGANTTDLRRTIFTSDELAGNFRLPTAGELALLVPMYTEPNDRIDINGGTKNGRYQPYWNDNPLTNKNSEATVETPFTETIYLEDGVDFMPNTSGPSITGITQLKVGNQSGEFIYPVDPGTDKYNIHPVYGLRFKGSDQYAAYRWESCPIDSDPLQRYLSVKIKALQPQDDTTTIEDVANDEKFWTDGSYIEFKIPASGLYTSQPVSAPNNGEFIGVVGYIQSATIKPTSDKSEFLICSTHDTCVYRDYQWKLYPIRLVKVE